MLKRVLTGITISLGSVCADQASRIRLMAFEPISPISRDGESLLFDPAPEDQFRGVIRVKNSEGDLISSTISLNRFSAVVEVPGGRESLTILRKVIGPMRRVRSELCNRATKVTPVKGSAGTSLLARLRVGG